jgi:hypothetical protein
MTTEHKLDVRIPLAEEERVLRLQHSAQAALTRHRQAPIGDRTDAVRFEQLQTAIEEVAFEELDRIQRGSPSTELSDTVLSVTWPFAPGVTLPPSRGTPKPVAAVFRSELDRPTRREAVEERFTSQLQRIIDGTASDSLEAINPSEIPNRVLAESLREFAAVVVREKAVEAPVVYRDGSPARSFPLRALRFLDGMPDDGREVLAVTLLSIRHMDMDARVDGAWLRNREISLRRPAGQTDELVYQQSVEQFAAISDRGPVALYLYQTGLPPANVGFYRALVDHHRKGSGHQVAVLPRYFEGGDVFSDGTPWVIDR